MMEKCLICGADVKKDEDGLFLNGAPGKVMAGYGSIYDCDIFHIRICDKCITKKLKSESIVKIGELRMTPTLCESIKEEYKNLL